MDGEVIVYDLKTNNALYLNETSAIIWNLCNGHRSVADIRRELNEEFGTTVSREFILYAIYQLRKDKLLSDDDEIDTYLKKFSGRWAIRKLGSDSMLALPSISSVIAPTAIAASCLAVPPVIGAQKTA
jgi:hypothetical protein